jgi:hypothetical protein
MMIRKTAVVVALAILFLSSTFALAATDLDAIEACSEAIATTIEKEQGAGVKFRIDDSGISPNTRLGRRTTFEMNAVDPSSNTAIGKFDCKVDSSAQVVLLRTVALDVPVAVPQNRS